MSDSATVPARIGRPSKAEQLLTPEMLLKVAELLLEGHHKETVADFLGITRKAWWIWEQRGEREPESIFSDFLHITRAAIAGAEIDTIRVIRSGQRGWESRAWLAERRFPQRWGKRVEITLRAEAEKLAAEYGLPIEQVLRDAEEAAAGASRG